MRPQLGSRSHGQALPRVPRLKSWCAPLPNRERLTTLVEVTIKGWFGLVLRGDLSGLRNWLVAGGGWCGRADQDASAPNFDLKPAFRCAHCACDVGLCGQCGASAHANIQSQTQGKPRGRARKEDHRPATRQLLLTMRAAQFAKLFIFAKKRLSRIFSGLQFANLICKSGVENGYAWLRSGQHAGSRPGGST